MQGSVLGGLGGAQSWSDTETLAITSMHKTMRERVPLPQVVLQLPKGLKTHLVQSPAEHGSEMAGLGSCAHWLSETMEPSDARRQSTLRKRVPLPHPTEQLLQGEGAQLAAQSVPTHVSMMWGLGGGQFCSGASTLKASTHETLRVRVPLPQEEEQLVNGLKFHL